MWLNGVPCIIPFNLICYMTTFSKNCFDLFTPPQGSGVEGENMCLHCALCSIPIHLICKLTMFRKKNVLTFDPNSEVEVVGKAGMCACMVLYVPSSLKICNITTVIEVVFISTV